MRCTIAVEHRGEVTGVITYYFLLYKKIIYRKAFIFEKHLALQCNVLRTGTISHRLWSLRWHCGTAKKTKQKQQKKQKPVIRWQVDGDVVSLNFFPFSFFCAHICGGTRLRPTIVDVCYSFVFLWLVMNRITCLDIHSSSGGVCVWQTQTSHAFPIGDGSSDQPAYFFYR